MFRQLKSMKGDDMSKLGNGKLTMFKLVEVDWRGAGLKALLSASNIKAATAEKEVFMVIVDFKCVGVCVLW
jgi:hypothetical protein